MHEPTAVIATIAASLGVAFLFGLIAARLRLPPIVGYLVAGVAVGPFTPGIVVDSGILAQASELGVILLMFGVGLHFSFRDLMTVRRVVLPGALLQLVITSSVGTAIGRAWGMSWGGALVMGIALAVASTVVLIKGFEAQDRLDSSEGRLAIGWLVVEDLAMVLVLVLLPAVAPMLGGSGAVAAGGSAALLTAIGIAVLKVLAFSVLMVVVGRRAVPWLLEHVARLGSRELFTLAVLATALGIATLAAEVFGVSFALGAFFAGAVVNESDLSHRAATDALPLQDAFAVLFFLSVGMLFNPAMVVEQPLEILALLAVIVFCKFTASFVLLRGLKQSPRTATIIAGSLSQIGEFSFIVTGLGVTLGLMTRDSQALVVAAALLSITINQPLQAGIQYAWTRVTGRPAETLREQTVEMRVPSAATIRQATDPHGTDLFDFSHNTGHVVVVGHGRVGATITDALQREGAPYVIVEEQERVVAGLRMRAERAVFGDATRAEVLHRAGIAGARLIVVTAPEPFRARRVVEVARGINPLIAVAVRTHSAAEQTYFEELLHAGGATGRAIYAEREAALSLAHFTLQTLGRSDDEADLVIDAMRNTRIMPTETFAAMQTREFRAMMGKEPRRPGPGPTP